MEEILSLLKEIGHGFSYEESGTTNMPELKVKNLLHKEEIKKDKD